MIITCPNCATRYSIDPGALGGNGKVVRCSNCDHQWHQAPRREPPRPQAPAYMPQPGYVPLGGYAPGGYGMPQGYGYPSQAPQMPPGYPQQPGYGYPPPPDPNAWGQPPVAPPPPPMPAPAAPQSAPPPRPASRPAPLPEPDPEPELDPDTFFEEPEPLPDPEPDPVLDDEPLIDEPVDQGDEPVDQGPADLDSLFGDDDDMPVAEAPDAAAPAMDDDEVLSEEQLDAMFGDDDPEPIGSMVEQDNSDLNDDFEDPDPIPGVFTSGGMADDDDEDDMPVRRVGRVQPKKKKSAAGTIIGICLAILLIAPIAGFFVARDAVVGIWPGAQAIYDMVGMTGPAPGAGLEITVERSDRDVENGVDVLKLTGSIANVTEDPVAVPMIRVSVSDETGEEVQFVVVPPEKNSLTPGDVMPFEAKLTNLVPTARSIKVTFSEPE